MFSQQLTFSLLYECLSSIGNSLEIESMMSEIVVTFARKTSAICGRYYENIDNEEPMVKIGKNISFDIKKYELKESDHVNHIVFIEDDKQIVVLPLKYGYLLFIYKNKEDSVEKLASLLGNFQHKINLSISACEGVSKLEQLNEELEDRVKKSIAKIRESEKMLISQSKQATMGEMIEMIAHQWRQPITSIGMIANNILLDIALDKLNEHTLTKELDKINIQVMHLSKTIDDFRDFFKESKEKNNIFISDVIDGTMIIIEKQLQQYNINIEIINKAKDIVINTFKNELIQVFLNIIGNSKDAFEINQIEDKKIIIECEAVDENIEIKIRDNAGGIEDEVLPKIFEPYFSTKNGKIGTGLGLYMSMIIVNKHLNGDIYVKNINDGVEFKIVLPIDEKNNDE
jgi:C4-dicarboxylate-specific signal transduction histidine kinase